MQPLTALARHINTELLQSIWYVPHQMYFGCGAPWIEGHSDSLQFLQHCIKTSGEPTRLVA
jgi:hypothetical protein